MTQLDIIETDTANLDVDSLKALVAQLKIALRAERNELKMYEFINETVGQALCGQMIDGETLDVETPHPFNSELKVFTRLTRLTDGTGPYLDIGQRPNEV